MSKMDDLRAMREARYDQASARASRPVAAPRREQRPAPKPVEAEQAPGGGDSAAPTLCGHRAISGRTCTREHGHAAKSHRYS